MLVLAQEEARTLRHGFIGTEHILLALIAEGDGVAAKALDELGVTLDEATALVKGRSGANATDNVAGGSPPFTPKAKKVLELSLREAVQLGHNYIGTEHLLLGVIRQDDSIAAEVLLALGADAESVRRKVMNLISRYGSRESSAETRSPDGGDDVPAGRRAAGHPELTDRGAEGGDRVISVVRQGRRPGAFAAAYHELAEVVASSGLGIDELDASNIEVRSVDIEGVPGLELQVTIPGGTKGVSLG